MPLPGGASDKYGLRYELSWTVLSITDVLIGSAHRIRFEPPGDEGEGIEFWVETDSGFEYHQVKRQRAGSGYWSLRTLDTEGILTSFFDRLSNPSASCVFASTHAAHPLDELSDRARGAKSWEEFKNVFLADQWSSGNFADLHRIWNQPDEEESFDRLKRIWVRTISEELLQTLVSIRLEMSVEGDTKSVFDSLNQFVLGAVYREFNTEDIWKFLTTRGYDSRNWGTDQTVIQAVEEQNLTYFSLIRQANIGGQVVPRIEVDQVCEKLDSDSGRNSVLLSGEAGTGKSLIIPQVVDRFVNKGCPVLAFRVDRLLPTFQPTELGTQLGLPGSPVSVLASIRKRWKMPFGNRPTRCGQSRLCPQSSIL